MPTAPIEEVIGRLESAALSCEFVAEAVHFHGTAKDELAKDIRALVAAFRAAKAPPKARNQIPPPPDEVTRYSAEIGYPLDGAKWCDYYAARGWLVGRVQMKDWQAAVRNWNVNGWGEGSVRIAPKKSDPNNGRDWGKF